MPPGYALSRETYYVVRFNNEMSIYLDKRLHYKNQSYKIRRDLALHDLNEYVDREFTSRAQRHNVYHSRRNLGQKAYKKKAYKFVDEIWALLMDIILAPVLLGPRYYERRRAKHR